MNSYTIVVNIFVNAESAKHARLAITENLFPLPTSIFEGWQIVSTEQNERPYEQI